MLCRLSWANEELPWMVLLLLMSFGKYFVLPNDASEIDFLFVALWRESDAGDYNSCRVLINN